MNLNTILKIPKVLIRQQQNKKDNEIFPFNDQNNNRNIKEERSSTNISSLTKEIDYLNNKIKIQDDKLIKIESSLETVINILKNKPEIDKRGKSNKKNHSSISLGSSEQNNKKSNKRKKYKKFAESNAINKYIEHIEIKEKDENVYQYHISNLYNKTMAANYYCADTSYSGRIKIIYDLEAEDNERVIKEIKYRKEHNKTYIDHSYCRLDIIKNDLMYKSKNTIIKNLVNYKYRHLVLKEIVFSNPTKFHKSKDLEEYFIQEYGNIKTDLRNIDAEEIENIKKFTGNKNEKIENIISLKNQCSNIINNLNSYIRKKSSLEELISKYLFRR